jgi:hypothetical protein
MRLTVIKPRGSASVDREILRSTFGVGKYRCTLTIDPTMVAVHGAVGALCVQWEPIPDRLNKKELAEYRRGRDGLFQRAADAIGGSILIAE